MEKTDKEASNPVTVQGGGLYDRDAQDSGSAQEKRLHLVGRRECQRKEHSLRELKMRGTFNHRG